MTWRLSSNSDGYFAIDDNGDLTFTSSRPDYNETDPDANVYTVGVNGSTATHASTEAYSVTVTLKQNTVGEISLDNADPPVQGQVITGRLIDPDDAEEMRWSWSKAGGTVESADDPDLAVR